MSESKTPSAATLPARQVRTLLSADITEFVKLAAELDPGPLLQDLSAYMTGAIPFIVTHGGEIHHCAGHELLASFEDPQAALQAARDILRHGALFVARQVASGKPRFYPQLGLSTGEILLANLSFCNGPAVTAIGDPVLFARRLRTRAPPSGLLMDEPTYAATGRPPGASAVELLPIAQDLAPATAYAIQTPAIPADST